MWVGKKEDRHSRESLPELHTHGRKLRNAKPQNEAAKFALDAPSGSVGG
jgi:hypothetical protein